MTTEWLKYFHCSLVEMGVYVCPSTFEKNNWRGEQWNDLNCAPTCNSAFSSLLADLCCRWMTVRYPFVQITAVDRYRFVKLTVRPSPAAAVAARGREAERRSLLFHRSWSLASTAHRDYAAVELSAVVLERRIVTNIRCFVGALAVCNRCLKLSVVSSATPCLRLYAIEDYCTLQTERRIVS